MKIQRIRFDMLLVPPFQDLLPTALHPWNSNKRKVVCDHGWVHKMSREQHPNRKSAVPHWNMASQTWLYIRKEGSYLLCSRELMWRMQSWKHGILRLTASLSLRVLQSKCLCPPLHSYVEILTSSETVLGDRVFRKVIRSWGWNPQKWT